MMKLKEKLFGCVILIVLSPTFLFSQAKPSRQSSINAFSKGDYEQAYSQFSQLLETYPKDPLYKYYSAACLVELKRDPAKAEDLLDQALGSSSLKSLPNEALFYLGRARQYTGNYKEAEKAYNRYTEAAGRKQARELNVPEYISQCRSGSGKLSTVAAAPVTAALKKEPEIQPADTAKQVSKTEPLPPEMDQKLGQVLNEQFKADSLNALAESSVTEVMQVPAAIPVDTVKKAEAKPVIPGPQVTIPKPQPQQADTGLTSVPQVINKPVQAEIPDTTIRLKTLSSTGSILSVFEVLPKPVTDPKEKISVNPEIPEGLVYRIQVAVFKNPVALSYFKGLSPVYGFKAPGSAVTTYYIGVFRRMADVAKALSTVRAKGFRDAFAVAQMDGKTVSADRATVLEKEWGNRSLFRMGKAEQEQAADTLPPALVFRVEVARTPKPLSDETVDDMKRIASGRPFDIQPMDDNTIAYLIGNFITFESASEYANILTRNGYRDSKVVAWLGKKQIDVDTARRLFESLK